MALSPQQEAFCVAYVAAKGNATAAYIGSYPKCKRESAHANSARLLANDRVKSRIAELTEAAKVNGGITVEWALRRLKEEADGTDRDSTPASRVAAIGLAIKVLGLAKEDAPHPDRKTPRVTDLTPEQREQVLATVRILRGKL